EDNTEFNLETTLVTSNLTVNATFTKKVVVEPGKDEITLNVEDTKDPTKEYSIVIGWYGKTATSGLDVEVMKVFANNLVKYLKAKGVSDEDIKKVSIRRYGDESTKVGPMGELINADGDCDLLLGVGKNITSAGSVQVVEKQEGILMGGKSRYIARVTDTKQIVKDLYDFIISANGENSMFLDKFVVPDNINSPSDVLNVEDTKDPTKEYSIVIGWYGKTTTSGLDVDAMKVFAANLVKYLKAKGVSNEDIAKVSIRRYGDADTNVGPMGELINADGDCDILLGIGSNIDDPAKGNVTVVEKQCEVTMGGKSRYIARVTDTKQIVKDLYDFIISSNADNSMFLDTFVAPTNA
ncbi:MAG: hypothetical protein SOW55_02295, partial [Bacilli bacterium]|nr:hypothetical protein [Bacilli bacterium]